MNNVQNQTVVQLAAASIKTCLKKTFIYKGRSSRSEYWIFSIAILVITLLLSFIQDYLTSNYPDIHTRDLINYTITFTTYLFCLPLISATTRRLHDVNKSGWWQLIVITVIGIPYFYYLTFKKSSSDENQYGVISWDINEGKRVAIIGLIVHLLYFFSGASFIDSFKQSFNEGFKWVYTEDIDAKTKQKSLMAKHITKDKSNNKVVVEYVLFCADSKILDLIISTYDDPNSTFGNPDKTLPTPILMEGKSVKASAMLGDTPVDVMSLDASNQIALYIPKQPAGKFLDGTNMSIKLATGRGEVNLVLDSKDSMVRKVVLNCPH
jgi:uncharacterized membrane protein YhaH (DUF805 family)